ncbi:MAG TPA: biotin/lipoate A/B protein ligase family protein [Candidatus Polarisedimenticolaceae bacterium]|nr:biotin/lipoate A/B protein ligase family protein [Candidatus Polarisedimenticolaceae bacterium]
MARVWRLIVDPPSHPAWNMAVDQVLLRRYADASSAPPTLRLYGWKPAALSLGRGQRLPSNPSIPVVRRATGGQAVLHDDERTYAVAGALRRDPFPSGVLHTYRRIAAALVAGLRKLGIEADAAEPAARTGRSAPVSCFDVLGAHEIAWGGRKLVGSAQVRARAGFLQHGSIPRTLDPERLSAVLGTPVDGERFTDLSRALGRTPSFEEIDAALIAGFEEALGARFEEDGLSPEERELAAQGQAQTAAEANEGSLSVG